MPHNKKMNTRIIYEALSHHVVNLLLEKKNPDKIFQLIERFFCSGPLKEELGLFKAIIALRGKSDAVISEALAEVRKHSQRINKKALNERKKELLAESLKMCPKLFDYKIKDYRLFASAHQFISECSKDLSGSIACIESKNEILDMLKENLQKEIDCSKTRYDNFIFLNAITTITENVKKLSTNQQRIVAEYLDVVSVNGDTMRFFREKVKEQLPSFEHKHELKNEETLKKLSVAKERFMNLTEDCSICEEHKLRSLLEYASLFEELKNK